MTRQYQIVLYGATGYTGKLTARYMATALPTDVTWAIAGRSESKLEELAAVCKVLNPDRIQPAIEVCNLNDPDLADLARKTTLLITTVGPYSSYGEHAFKACAENGTNYLDCTGESPFVLDMIKKYEKAAKSTGAIMIPQIGIESCPSDISTWILVSLIRKELSAPTGPVFLSVKLKALASGGTLSTIFTLFDNYSLRDLVAASAPYALSPIPGPTAKSPSSLLSRILGVRSVPGLGFLTDSLQAASDVPIIHRTWGLLGGPKFYGPNFSVAQYSATRRKLTGILTHAAFSLGSILILLPPLRWLLRRLVTAPGKGPTAEQTKDNYVDYKGIGYPDNATHSPRAFVRVQFKGSMYELTALIMVEAAITLMKDDVVAKKLGGGVLTPATLGQPFVDRLNNAGFKIESRMLED